MLSSRRLTAVTIGSLAVSLGLWGAGYLPAATAASATDSAAKYYFHGAGQGNDDVNRTNGSPSATFSTTAPTGTADSTQTGDDPVANTTVPANNFIIYWVGTAVPAGSYTGNLHLDWWWQAPNPSDAAFKNQVDVTVWTDVDVANATGTQIGGASGLEVKAPPTAPAESTADVPIDGTVVNNLLIQVKPHFTNGGTSDTAHYDSTAAPSYFTMPASGPAPSPTPSSSPPPYPDPQGPQRFMNFVSPQPNPHDPPQPPCCASLLKGEPSIGVDWVTNNTMYQGDLNTWQIHFTYADGQTPTADWLDRSHLSTDQMTLDARLIVDHTGAARGTGDRTIVDQLAGVQSVQAYSDDDGGTAAPPANTGDYVASSAGGIPVGPDHESLGAGPYATPLPPTANTSVYPHAVYYCGQGELLSPQPGPIAFCSRSDTGGATYGPGEPVYQQSQCSGLHGKPRVGPDGTVYLPNKDCSAAGGAQAAKGLLVSTDNGQTWTLHNIPGTSTDDNQPDPDVAVGGTSGAGTVYYAYRDGDHHAKVVVSTDRGTTWSTPFDVGAYYGIQNAQFPEVIAGDADRAAVSFIGTRAPGDDLKDDFKDPATGKPAEWHLYVAYTYDGGATWQTVDATPSLPVQRGGVCMSGTGCTGSDRNMLDFNDMNIDRDGRVQVAYTDGCVDACETDPSTSTGKFASVFSLVDQTCGQGLFAAHDAGFNNDPNCGPSATLPEAPRAVALAATGMTVFGVVILLRRRRRRRTAL